MRYMCNSLYMIATEIFENNKYHLLLVNVLEVMTGLPLPLPQVWLKLIPVCLLVITKSIHFLMQKLSLSASSPISASPVGRDQATTRQQPSIPKFKGLVLSIVTTRPLDLSHSVGTRLKRKKLSVK